MLLSLGSGVYLGDLKFWIDSGTTPDLPSGCTPENAKRISKQILIKKTSPKQENKRINEGKILIDLQTFQSGIALVTSRDAKK